MLRAIQKATDDRLRLYPDPAAQPLREALADFHDCKPANIIVGNGSDELLALATRCFVEPKQPDDNSNRQVAGQTIQYFTPSYSLYPILANIHGARINEVKLLETFTSGQRCSQGKQLEFQSGTYVTTPNAPSGRGYRTRDLAKLCEAQKEF